MGHDPETREYPQAADHIREILIHQNYLSQKDIEICLAFDLESMMDQENYTGIEDLHRTLQANFSENTTIARAT
jgi:hypothetical protein